MFFRLLFLFVTIPILELIVFLVLGSKIGIPATLVTILATAFLGAYLTKSQGLQALRRYQEALAQGRLPHEEVLDGLMILIAGAVLLTPGFLTDALGFALLVPTARQVVKALVKKQFTDRVHTVGEETGVFRSRSASGRSSSPPGVITVESELVEDAPSKKGERVSGDRDR